jgi:hypothetical protein
MCSVSVLQSRAMTRYAINGVIVDAAIERNTFVSEDVGVLAHQGSRGLIVRGNLFVRCLLPLASAVPNVNIQSLVVGLEDNLFWDCVPGAPTQSSNQAEAAGSAANWYARWENNTEKPVFRDPDHGDYSLIPGSDGKVPDAGAPWPVNLQSQWPLISVERLVAVKMGARSASTKAGPPPDGSKPGVGGAGVGTQTGPQGGAGSATRRDP